MSAKQSILATMNQHLELSVKSDGIRSVLNVNIVHTALCQKVPDNLIYYFILITIGTTPFLLVEVLQKRSEMASHIVSKGT